MTRFEWREDISVFDELEKWWNQQQGPRRSPFLRTEWFRLWARHRLGSDDRLRVLVAREGGDPVGAVPLFQRGPRFFSMSSTDSDSFDMVSNGDPRVEAAIVAKLHRTTYVAMDRLEGSSPLARGLESSGPWRIQRELNAPFIVTADGLDPVLVDMGKKLRSNVRRGGRNLAALGEVSMQPTTAVADLPEVFDEAMALEADGWKGEIGRAVASSPATLGFYRDLAEVASNRGWLRLGVLRLDGRMVAFNFDLEYEGRMFGIITSYDEALDGKCSPGHVLLWQTLEACVDRGVRTYELGGGHANSWKMRWTNSTRPVYDVVGFGRNLKGRAAHLVSSVRSSFRR